MYLGVTCKDLISQQMGHECPSRQDMLTVDFPVTREYMASRLAASGLSGLSYSRPTKAAQQQ